MRLNTSNSRLMQAFVLALVASLASMVHDGTATAVGSTARSLPAGNSAEEPNVAYHVDLSDCRNHYVTIEMTAKSTAAETQVMMAVWTPGSYLVREYARHLDSMEVTTLDGEPLDYKKVRKNRWRVTTGDHGSFKVRYRIYCNETSVRTNYVGYEYAVLNGAPTFLTVPEHLDSEHHVKLSMPRHWTRSATSLNAGNGGGHSFVASDFDELVDSPIVAGNVSVYPFEVAGVPHQLVNVGESGFWDGTKAAADLKKIVAAHHEMWGVVPYDRYLFLNVLCESGGGLEHDNSCLIMTSRWTYRNKSRYKSWLSLASHEFFHTWNIRRLRPKNLIRYDYENEVYTDSLWVAEGITSYYEDLLLTRSGLYSQSDFLGSLSSSIASVQRTRGRLKQSLTESSYDAWIKFYRSDENSSNTRISYYSKGSVVAMLLDAEIRKATKGEKSLDDVMQTMYERFLEDGYTPDDFRKVSSEIAGTDLSDWFAAHIDSTDELDYDPMMKVYGLKYPGYQADEDKDKTAKVETTDKEDDDSEEKKAGRPWLGFSGVESVSRVASDSPATEAGVNTGDEIIAINGYRVKGSLDSRLSQFEVGDEIDLLISRRGKLRTLKIEIGSEQRKSWTLSVAKKPNARQREMLADWLGNDEPEDDEEVAEDEDDEEDSE